MTAAAVYLRSGLLRRLCLRGFWPLFFVRLVTEVELSPLQLVLLGTVMELSILTMEVPTGIVADVYSRKLSVITSFLVMGAAMMLSGVFETYWLLLVAQAMMGFGNTFETGAETAWITGELGSAEATEPVILHRARWQLIAGVVGIGLWAGLAAVTTLSVAIVAIGVVFMLWGLALLVIMPENGFVRTPGEGWSRSIQMFRAGLAQARNLSVLRILVIVVFIGGLAKEAIDRLDVQRLVDVGMPSTVDEVVVVGAITAVKLGLASVLLTVVGRRASGAGVVMTMALLLIAVAVGVGLLAFAGLLGIAALGLVLQGGASFATQPLVTTWTNSFAENESRATVHSFMGQSEAFGEILGGVALGIVAELAGVPTAMTVSMVLFAGAGLLAMTARGAWATSTASVADGTAP